MNFFSKILAKCGGAHIETLEQCPSEISKFVSVGITICFTGIFAAFSGGYAFYKVFNNEIVTSSGHVENTFLNGAILMGVLWGFMIFNLDRFIVMSIRKRNDKLKEFYTALPRIVLAIIISLVVAKPLEVRLFQDRITAQISDNELSKREQNKNRIYGITNKNAIDGQKNASEGNVVVLRQQTMQDCPTKECKDAFKAQNEAYNKYSNVEKEAASNISVAKRDINFIKNTDTYKTSVTIDGEEKKELTPEGNKKLIDAQNRLNFNISKRDSEYIRYKSKLAIYDRLNNTYKKGKQAELNDAINKDKELANQKEEADSIASVLLVKTGQAAEFAYTNNFITQIEALGDLTTWNYDVYEEVDGVSKITAKANNTMWYMDWAIILLFIVIETAPIFVKLISSKGQYDIALEANDTKKESGFIHDANTDIAIAEQKSQLQLQVLMNNQQAQLGMVQTVIQSWQAQKTQELNNGQLSDIEYKAVIKEILEFDIISNSESKKSKTKKTYFIFQLINRIIENIKRKMEPAVPPSP